MKGGFYPGPLGFPIWSEANCQMLKLQTTVIQTKQLVQQKKSSLGLLHLAKVQTFEYQTGLKV